VQASNVIPEVQHRKPKLVVQHGANRAVVRIALYPSQCLVKITREPQNCIEMPGNHSIVTESQARPSWQTEVELKSAKFDSLKDVLTL